MSSPSATSHTSGVIRKQTQLFLRPKTKKNTPENALWIQSPCQMMIGGDNHILSKVFWFHYHSQKVIGFLGRKKSHLENPFLNRKFIFFDMACVLVFREKVEKKK